MTFLEQFANNLEASIIEQNRRLLQSYFTRGFCLGLCVSAYGVWAGTKKIIDRQAALLDRLEAENKEMKAKSAESEELKAKLKKVV